MDTGERSSPASGHFLFHQARRDLVRVGMVVGCRRGLAVPARWTGDRGGDQHSDSSPHLRTVVQAGPQALRESTDCDRRDDPGLRTIFAALARAAASVYDALPGAISDGSRPGARGRAAAADCLAAIAD